MYSFVPAAGCYGLYGCIFYVLGRVVMYCRLHEHDLLYILFIRRLIVVNINVSNIKLMHMLNFLDTFSMGVTFIEIGDAYSIEDFLSRIILHLSNMLQHKIILSK
jgi:hypothetical protein